jgi:hypothetical protein
MLRSFAAGPAFVLTADVPSMKRLVTQDEASLRSWMAGSAASGETAVTNLWVRNELGQRLPLRLSDHETSFEADNDALYHVGSEEHNPARTER